MATDLQYGDGVTFLYLATKKLFFCTSRSFVSEKQKMREHVSCVTFATHGILFVAWLAAEIFFSVDFFFSRQCEIRYNTAW